MKIDRCYYDHRSGLELSIGGVYIPNMGLAQIKREKHNSDMGSMGHGDF